MLNESIIIFFQVGILIMSVVIHEFSHGWAALQQGDPTAKYAGRLTLNPVKHLELWGSVVVPFLFVLFFSFPFGWAKPVPFNPYNLKDQKFGPAIVGVAGPLSNILLALIFGLAARILQVNMLVKKDIIINLFEMDYNGLSYAISGSFAAIFFFVFVLIASVNILLAFFNLIPIPPLDGSKLLFAFLPLRNETIMLLEQFGFFILMFVIFFLSEPLGIFLGLVRHLFFYYVIGVAI